MSGLLKAVGWLGLLGSVFGGIGAFGIFTAVNQPISLTSDGLIFEVRPGTNIGQVTRELARQKVLVQPRALAGFARLFGYAGSIRAGEYRLNSGLTGGGVLRTFVDGRVLQRTLTLLEGWNFRQVMAAVEASPYLRHTLTGLDGEEIMARVAPPEQHPEGWFFPDTYQFPKGTSDVDFLRRAHARMKEQLSLAWRDRVKGLPLESPYEALILASIVEKETGLERERPTIAGVFVRRLKKRMRLETDPTVIYGLGNDFDGNLRRKDLRTDTAYNTYTRKGLPPTPIAMPGNGSLWAATHPAPGDALYFVARGDGGHQFSATYAAHLRAVRKYQLRN